MAKNKKVKAVDDLWEALLNKPNHGNELKFEFTKSSLLESAKYNVLTKDLVLKFKTTPKSVSYVFYDVPKETCKEFFEAESAGSYFARTIKGRYSHSRVEEKTKKKTA